MRRFFNNQSNNKKDEKPLKARLLNYRKNKKQTLLAKETQKQNLLEQQQTQTNRNVSPTNIFEQNQPNQQYSTNQNQQSSTENTKNKSKIKSELLQLPKPAWRSVLENFGFDILDNYPMRKWREFCSKNPLMCWILTGITWAICQYLAAKAEFGFVFFAIFLLLLILLNLGTREEGELSAYSVFNENFIRLEGELTSEDFESEILMRRRVTKTD
ncbi:hypothetical protein ACQ4LE_009477 [Meloidogyne hapla]|uniref:SAYSvFN domain-containing protein n=1 Tax=Meloidogyne hapla TaxID=6305 RepID=A0A1I8B1S7_MELHA